MKCSQNNVTTTSDVIRVCVNRVIMTRYEISQLRENKLFGNVTLTRHVRTTEEMAATL